MNILKYIFIAAIAFSCVSCDDSSSGGTGVKSATIEEMGKVVGFSFGRTEINIIEDQTKLPKTLVVDERTSVSRQRSSCSGFEYASHSDIQGGDILVYYYRLSDDRNLADNKIVPFQIEAYLPNCVRTVTNTFQSVTTEIVIEIQP